MFLVILLAAVLGPLRAGVTSAARTVVRTASADTPAQLQVFNQPVTEHGHRTPVRFFPASDRQAFQVAQYQDAAAAARQQQAQQAAAAAAARAAAAKAAAAQAAAQAASSGQASGAAQSGPAPGPAPSSTGNSETGGASWYSAPAGTCAHRTLPFGTVVTVTNLATGASTTCRVEDRGPFVSGRIIDMSPDTFDHIASTSEGVIQVRIQW